jgi:large subunit ribosomal protein L10
VPTQKKRSTIDSLANELSKSRGLILTSYRGLTVSDFAAIRNTLRPLGITYRVVKNRLMRVAANEAGNATLPSHLSGPTAIAFGTGDEAVLAKTVLAALKAYPAAEVRGAILGTSILDLAQLTALSKLPSREVLLATVSVSPTRFTLSETPLGTSTAAVVNIGVLRYSFPLHLIL